MPYRARMYITPNEIIDLLKPEFDCEIRAVYWQDDRQAYVCILDMPDDERYLVEPGHPISEIGLHRVVTEDEYGGRHLRLSLRGDSDSAPNRRTQKHNQKTSRPLEATQRAV